MLSLIKVYSCESQRKRRPLKHGSLYGLPITALKFFPFKDDQLITASKCLFVCPVVQNQEIIISIES